MTMLQTDWAFRDGERFIIRDVTGEIVASGVMHHFRDGLQEPCYLAIQVDQAYKIERYSDLDGRRVNLIPVIPTGDHAA